MLQESKQRNMNKSVLITLDHRHLEGIIYDCVAQALANSQAFNTIPNTQVKPLAPATIKQGSEYLSINRTTLNSLIKSGQIKSFNIGRHVRIEWSELDNYIRNQKGEDHG